MKRLIIFIFLISIFGTVSAQEFIGTGVTLYGGEGIILKDTALIQGVKDPVSATDAVNYRTLLTASYKDPILTSIADLKIATDTLSNKQTLGYYTEGDNGHGEYYWVTNSGDRSNGGTVIQSSVISTDGKWVLMPQSEYRAEQFGFSHSNIDSITVNARILDSLMPLYTNNIKLLENEYWVDTLDWTGWSGTIIGSISTAGRANSKKSVLRYKGSDRDVTFVSLGGIDCSASNLTTTKGTRLQDIEFYGLTSGDIVSTGINIVGLTNSILENINISFFDVGIRADYTWSNRYTDIIMNNIQDTTVIIGKDILGSGQNGNVWDGLHISGSDSLIGSVYTKQFNDITFRNCVVDGARQWDFSVNPIYAGSLNINGGHWEDTTGSLIQIDNNSTDSIVEHPRGDILIQGIKYGMVNLFRLRDNAGYDSSRLITYTSETDSNSIHQITIDGLFNIGSPPRRVAYNLYDASNVLKLDVSHFRDSKYGDSANYAVIVNKGNRVKDDYKEHGWWKDWTNEKLLNNISTRDTTRWAEGGAYTESTMAIGSIGTVNAIALANDYASNDEIVLQDVGTYTLSNLTIPSGKKLIVGKGCVLDITGTLTITDLEIEAGNYQIFSSTSTISGTITNDYWNESWFVDFDNALTQMALPYKLNVIEATTMSGDYVQDRDIVLIGNNSEVDLGGFDFDIRYSFDVSNVDFTNGDSYGLYLDESLAEDLNDISFYKCNFYDTPSGIRISQNGHTGVTLSSFSTSYCSFDNVKISVGVHTECADEIYIGYNTFKNYTRPAGDIIGGTEMYNIMVGSSTSVEQVNGALIEGNESYGHINNEPNADVASMFLWCFGTDVLVTNNYLHDTETVDSTAIGFTGIYMHGLRSTASFNTVNNFQKGYQGSSIVAKSAHGGRMIISNNSIINTDTSLTYLARATYCDGVATINNNYIYTRWDSTDVDSYDMSMSTSGWDITGVENNTSIINDNYINSDRQMLLISGKRPNSANDRGINKVFNNTFISKNRPFVGTNSADNCVIIETGGGTLNVNATEIDNNIFRTEGGMLAYYSGATYFMESFKFTNNDVSSIDTAQTEYAFYKRVIYTAGDPIYYAEISGNTFDLKGVGSIGTVSAKNLLYENNQFNLDYQFTSYATASATLATFTPSTHADAQNWVFKNNIVKYSDTTSSTATSSNQMVKFNSSKVGITFENDTIYNGNSSYSIKMAEIAGATILTSKNNKFTNLSTVYGEYIGGDATFENDIAVDGIGKYYIDRTNASSVLFRDLNINTSLDAITFAAVLTDNATIDNCIITGSSTQAIYQYTGKILGNLTIKDSDITGLSTYALRMNGGATNVKLSNSNFTATGNGIYINSDITNMYMDLVETNKDIRVYTGRTITNLYGLNKGEDYGWQLLGAITNPRGIWQVETGVDIANQLYDTEVLGDFTSQSIIDDGTEVDIDTRLILADNLSQSSQTVTGATTISLTNVYCTSDATGVFDLTLPTYSTTTGNVYIIKNYSGYTVTLKPATGEAMNGVTNGTVSIPDGSEVGIHNSGISGIEWSSTAVIAR